MKSYCSATFIVVALALGHGLSLAQETRKEDLWTHERDKQYGHIMATAELTLHPMPEARPALRYRLVRDRYEMRIGDSAPFYLKAIGFFEQTNAQAAVREFIQTNAKKAREEGKEDYPPYIWLETPPKELPKEEVKKFLQWMTFQSQFLEEASYRSTFHLGRDMKQIEDPIAYLLPEIQQLRELARMQSLRTRMAIAEDQVDDALVILRQQYSLAKHLGDDEFIVSNLVGAAIAGIAFGDSLHLLQHANTPNLYWAFASLPDPLIDMSNANSYERNLLVEQVKVLREVSEEVRPAGFWSDFIDRLVPSILSLQSELSIAGNGPEQLRAGVVGMIAASYPNAKRFLIEDCGMPKAKVESYPTPRPSSLPFANSMTNEPMKISSGSTFPSTRRPNTAPSKQNALNWMKIVPDG